MTLHEDGARTTTGIIAAIPAYNEAGRIASVVAKAIPLADEVIVIDDGSRDATAAVAAAAGATVIRHERNAGKSAAIMTAFRAGQARRPRALVLLDGDGQHDPGEIPLVAGPVLSGAADLVVGSRYLEVKSPIPRYRTFGQRALNLATWVGSGIWCSDSQCGFRAFGRRAYGAIQLSEASMFGLVAESEMQFEIAARDLRLAEVPVYVRYDEPARRNPFSHGAAVLLRIGAMTLQGRALPTRATRPAGRLSPALVAADVE